MRAAALTWSEHLLLIVAVGLQAWALQKLDTLGERVARLEVLTAASKPAARIFGREPFNYRREDELVRLGVSASVLERAADRHAELYDRLRSGPAHERAPVIAHCPAPIADLGGEGLGLR